MKKLLLGMAAFLIAQVAIAQCAPTFGWQFAPTGQNLLNVNFNNSTGFTNTSMLYASYSLSFGDGSPTTYFGSTTSHNYNSPGTYSVRMIMEVHDSMTNVLICRDSFFQNVTVNYTLCASTFTHTASPTNTAQITFTASTPGAGSLTPTYTWSFGDGTSGTGSPVNHTYSTSGSYTVTLTIVNGNCTYQVTQTFTVNTGVFNCAGHTATFQTGMSSNTVSVYNTSPNFAGQYLHSLWNFGDGTTGTGNTTSHTYSAPGSYVIVLNSSWTDTMGTLVYCTSSVTHTVTATAAPNVIRGYIVKDSLNMPSTYDSFKVWLITYNAQTSILNAVDSQVVSNYNWAVYEFQNKPAGTYLTKAAKINGANSGTGLIPTYHDSSLYWSTATNIAHNGGYTGNENIYMRTGTITSGPGFVGGNVNQGANKGTGTTGSAVPNMQIMLRDANNNLVKFAYTDANGDFSFSNLPLGTYSLYPEEMNYITTPYTNITLTVSAPSASGFIFGVTNDEIKPKTTGIAAVNNDNFSLYPNPSNGSVFIKWSQLPTTATAIVTDLAGHVVYKNNLSINSNRSEINLSQLQSGVYFIKIETDKGLNTQKLFLQR